MQRNGAIGDVYGRQGRKCLEVGRDGCNIAAFKRAAKACGRSVFKEICHGAFDDGPHESAHFGLTESAGATNRLGGGEQRNETRGGEGAKGVVEGLTLSAKLEGYTAEYLDHFADGFQGGRVAFNGPCDTGERYNSGSRETHHRVSGCCRSAGPACGLQHIAGEHSAGMQHDLPM